MKIKGLNEKIGKKGLGDIKNTRAEKLRLRVSTMTCQILSNLLKAVLIEYLSLGLSLTMRHLREV